MESYKLWRIISTLGMLIGIALLIAIILILKQNPCQACYETTGKVCALPFKILR
jgi:hypothetical protein